MSLKQENIDLEKVLEINEYIKSIDSLAFFIKLNALNAFFLANRSGEQLRGYIVVTDEFNRFSGELMQFVENLLSIIHEVVFLVSDNIKQNHRLRLYERALKDTRPDSVGIINDFIKQHDLVVQKIRDEIAANMASLGLSLMRNEKMILKGDMLAMQAKIEGAYSRNSREVFMDVAENFQKHIGRIRQSLQGLKKMLQDR